MTITKLVLVLVCLMALPLEIKEAKVTPLFSKDLPDFPGMITVEYPPGSSDPIHRHNADAFVYVLEGSIVMQLRGGKEVTLTPGETFYEGPDDVHVVGKNASQTKPAKFVVFLVKDKALPYWFQRTKSKTAGVSVQLKGRMHDSSRMKLRLGVATSAGRTMAGPDAPLAIG